jgi:hypothetical protein
VFPRRPQFEVDRLVARAGRRLARRLAVGLLAICARALLFAIKVVLEHSVLRNLEAVRALKVPLGTKGNAALLATKFRHFFGLLLTQALALY